MKYSDLTQEEKNKLAADHERLVNKMTSQFFNKGVGDWDAIKSMAYEGLAIAINTYDSDKSSMTFTKFAAFYILNTIRTSLDKESRIVTLSNYAQKKWKATYGEKALFNSVRLSQTNDDSNHRTSSSEYKMKAYTADKFSDGDVYEYMYSRIDETFQERDRKIFYMAFGLNGFTMTTGKDIAEELNVSEGLVSQKIKKMAAWIRKDQEMCEALQTLYYK